MISFSAKLTDQEIAARVNNHLLYLDEGASELDVTLAMIELLKLDVPYAVRTIYRKYGNSNNVLQVSSHSIALLLSGLKPEPTELYNIECYSADEYGNTIVALYLMLFGSALIPIRLGSIGFDFVEWLTKVIFEEDVECEKKCLHWLSANWNSLQPGILRIVVVILVENKLHKKLSVPVVADITKSLFELARKRKGLTADWLWKDVVGSAVDRKPNLVEIFREAFNDTSQKTGYLSVERLREIYSELEVELALHTTNREWFLDLQRELG